MIAPRPATMAQLLEFHSPDYIELLEKLSEDGGVSDDDSDTQETLEEYGLLDDAPPFADMLDYSRAVAGATLCAAQLLVRGVSSTAINWCGGRHHAKRDEASGFCYVNDVRAMLCECVLSLQLCELKLQLTFGSYWVYEVISRVSVFPPHCAKRCSHPVVHQLVHADHSVATRAARCLPACALR